MQGPAGYLLLGEGRSVPAKPLAARGYRWEKKGTNY